MTSLLLEVLKYIVVVHLIGCCSSEFLYCTQCLLRWAPTSPAIFTFCDSRIFQRKTQKSGQVMNKCLPVSVKLEAIMESENGLDHTNIHTTVAFLETVIILSTPSSLEFQWYHWIPEERLSQAHGNNFLGCNIYGTCRFRLIQHKQVFSDYVSISPQIQCCFLIISLELTIGTYVFPRKDKSKTGAEQYCLNFVFFIKQLVLQLDTLVSG